MKSYAVLLGEMSTFRESESKIDLLSLNYVYLLAQRDSGPSGDILGYI